MKHDLVKYIHLSGVRFTCSDQVQIVEPNFDNNDFMKDYYSENVLMEQK